jgi:hypothetical protein
MTWSGESNGSAVLVTTPALTPLTGCAAEANFRDRYETQQAGSQRSFRNNLSASVSEQAFVAR